MLFFLVSRKGPTAGYAGSDASGDRRKALGPGTDRRASQNQRGSVGILSVQGEEDVKFGGIPLVFCGLPSRSGTPCPEV